MTLLDVQNLSSFYGDFQALFDIDFSLTQGETVAIIGSNGAGKSTFLRSIAGLVTHSADRFHYRDQPITDQSAYNIVSLGIAMVPEGRRLFPSLTVEQNLLIGGYAGRSGAWTLSRVYDMFPILLERSDVPGTALSGGEQQMVAIGRALIANPDLLLFDELSLGLAPIIIKDIYDILPSIQAEGISMIVVEQDIKQALNVADRVYCFQEGRVSLEGRPDELTEKRIAAAYFGR
ncbi:MAG: ABC transporter ATP-binding protein [Planctomycetes bacterium]|nr:ABC transporter ATP-binding protein [Planctomycetota bacterium]